jgi:uncharacterized membrane protein YqaE (UPF0057 family)
MLHVTGVCIWSPRLTLTKLQSDILLYFLALFIPPIPVFLKRGCGADVLINICLWVLGW